MERTLRRDIATGLWLVSLLGISACPDTSEIRTKDYTCSVQNDCADGWSCCPIDEGDGAGVCQQSCPTSSPDAVGQEDFIEPAGLANACLELTLESDTEFATSRTYHLCPRATHTVAETTCAELGGEDGSIFTPATYFELSEISSAIKEAIVTNTELGVGLLAFERIWLGIKADTAVAFCDTKDECEDKQLNLGYTAPVVWEDAKAEKSDGKCVSMYLSVLSPDGGDSEWKISPCDKQLVRYPFVCVDGEYNGCHPPSQDQDDDPCKGQVCYSEFAVFGYKCCPVGQTTDPGSDGHCKPMN